MSKPDENNPFDLPLHEDEPERQRRVAESLEALGNVLTKVLGIRWKILLSLSLTFLLMLILVTFLIYLTVQQNAELNKFRETFSRATEAMAKRNPKFADILSENSTEELLEDPSPILKLIEDPSLSRDEIIDGLQEELGDVVAGEDDRPFWRRWTLQKADDLDPDVYLSIRREDEAEGILIYNSEVKTLLKGILGGTADLQADRYHLATLRARTDELDVLLDRYQGNVWLFNGKEFKQVPVEGHSELHDVNTSLGAAIDILVERTSGHVLQKRDVSTNSEKEQERLKIDNGN